MTTISEAMNSVTGFDEIAVEKHFGMDLYQMAEVKPLMTTRAAAFVVLRHGDVTDKEAYEQVMAMPMGELEGFFEDDPEDIMPDQPDSESGKGPSPLSSVQPV